MTSRSFFILTFDVEEFDLLVEYSIEIGWLEQLEIGAEGWSRILALLEDEKVEARLIVTGAIGQAFPEFLEKSKERLEIGAHNVRHARDCPQQPVQAKQMLEEIGDVEVLGYGRPRFTPVDNDELHRAGYVYNSSMNPTWLPGRYNLFSNRGGRFA